MYQPMNYAPVLSGRYERQEGKLVQVEPDRPAPAVMTADEAVRYLRLDESGVKNPKDTLDRYRAMGLLRGTQLGRTVRYLLTELNVFLEKQTKVNPR